MAITISTSGNVQDWERAAFEASWNLPDEPKELSRPAKKQKKIVAPVVVQDDSWRLQYQDIAAQNAKAAVKEATLAQMEAVEIEQDDEEVMQVIAMILDYEKKVLGIPSGLQSASFIEV